jgi:hypothetical protein
MLRANWKASEVCDFKVSIGMTYLIRFVEASKIYIILAFFISGNIESMVKIDIQRFIPISFLSKVFNLKNIVPLPPQRDL